MCIHFIRAIPTASGLISLKPGRRFSLLGRHKTKRGFFRSVNCGAPPHSVGPNSQSLVFLQLSLHVRKIYSLRSFTYTENGIGSKETRQTKIIIIVIIQNIKFTSLWFFLYRRELKHRHNISLSYRWPSQSSCRPFHALIQIIHIFGHFSRPAHTRTLHHYE